MTISFIITIITFLLLSRGVACRPLRRQAQDDLGLSDGIWTFRGYGYALSVNTGAIQAFEETDISCIANPLLLMAITGVEAKDDVANVTAYRFVPYFVLDRTDSFQAACANGLTPVVSDTDYTRDALVDFDVLDQTFVENFAHFDSRLMDGMSEWVMKTLEVRANLTSNSTDQELASAFESLLVPLDDYHTWVGNDKGPFVWSHEFLWEFQEEFEKQTAIGDWETYQQDMIITPWRENAAGYMKDGLNIAPSGLAWGRTNESNIGYLFLTTIPSDMFAFAPDFEAALSALDDTDTIVIDIRVNQGGSDETALLITSHFASEPFLAFTKQAVGGDVVEVYVEPSEKVYNGPVIMIISQSSYSAAETLPLAMMQLPQTTLLGRNTGGSYSELPKTLPNGWAFSFFAEVYLSPDGVDYDQVGIPPEISPEAELLPLSERETGVDSWLELALKTAEDSTTSDAAKAHYWSLLCFTSFIYLVV
jgi:carboxyl-terminal processing protease